MQSVACAIGHTATVPIKAASNNLHIELSITDGFYLPVTNVVLQPTRF